MDYLPVNPDFKTLIFNFFNESNPIHYLNPLTNFKKLFSLYNDFITNWKLKNKSFIKEKFKIDFEFSFNALNFSLVFITRTFSLSTHRSFIKENFCFILSKNSSSYFIDYIISKEHTPILYSKLKNNSFTNFDLQIYSSNSIHYYETLCNNFNSISPLIIQPSSRTSRNFDYKRAIYYAEKYSLTYNLEYKSFHEDGGDCTNFASQVLSYAGITKNSTWAPYKPSWIRVQGLHSYLIHNKIASEKKEISLTSPGSIIQFFHKEKKTWTHSGIITYLRDNQDCLYCCHSYDKLNYPLSLVYPSIYPKFRVLTPF